LNGTYWVILFGTESYLALVTVQDNNSS